MVDIYLWQKIGVYWPIVPRQDAWITRAKGSCLHSNIAHNIKELRYRLPCHPGDVEVVLTVLVTPRVITAGKDSNCLGS